MCWSFLPHVRFLILLTVFELLPKTCNFTICSIFSNSGHVGWCTESPDTILKLDTLVMIQTKFGFHWSCTFRGEDFWKSLRRTTDHDDGRQVMAIAHMTLLVRWAKKASSSKQCMFVFHIFLLLFLTFWTFSRGYNSKTVKGIIVKIELDNNLTVVSTVEPVKSDTPRDQGNVSDCTRCWKTQVFFLFG
jgi:hypothetical protein